MSDRRGTRFLCEVAFLGALAACGAVAKLDDARIAGVMFVGWLLVALFEWAAWRGRPHYGAGLPPRYYVPRVSLPPPVTVEQRASAHGFRRTPGADDAPTWIASPAVRTEVLGEWPVAATERGDEVSAPTIVDPWLVAALPAEPGQAPARAPAPTQELVPVPDEPRGQPLPTRPAPTARRPYDGPTALHTLDPFAEPAGRRRRRGAAEPLRVEVPAGPPADRGLPGSAR